MADVFQLGGSYTTAPASGAPSADPSYIAPIDESMTLIRKHHDTIDLSTDAVTPISFGGVINAHVLIIKTVGGKVSIRLTSADGSTQAVPVDSFLAVMSNTVPITAADLTRVPGQETICKVFLGEHG
jgi:hypothetical protein